MLEPNEKLSSSSRGSDITFEVVKLNGTDAYLFLAKDGTSSIEFMIGGMYESVVGSLSKDEVIKVAQNIN
jgi:hypothetical protein